MLTFLKRIIIAYAIVGALVCVTHIANAQTIDEVHNSSIANQEARTQPDQFFRAHVVEILEQGTEMLDGEPQEYQKVQLQILNGDEKDKRIVIEHGRGFIIGTFQPVTKGETVVIAKPATAPGGRETYYIVDKYRAPHLLFLIGVFFACAIYFGRKRGLTSIIGLLFTILIIFYFVIPHIAHGGNPFITCVVGSFVITFFSLYLSHGFNRRTTIALLSTLIMMGGAFIIDISFVHLAKLIGNGTEEAFYLQFDNFHIDLRGLLLGSIILGVIGVLDDVTTGQSAAVEEIHSANPKLSFHQLYQSGISVGREHIASLINTLVLAYVGASFPLLLLYSTNKTQPLWITLNSNFIAEEMVRTLVGSTVLVIAVPLTTFLAAYYYSHLKRASTPTLLTPEKTIEALWGKK